MPTLRELSRWIRDYGHDPRHQSRLLADRFVWHQLWTAMDVIDDVDSALTAYEQNDFPTNTGEKYLRIYSALQGLFIQQDALRDLIKVIHPAKKIAFNDVLKDIREVRNKSIGQERFTLEGENAGRSGCGSRLFERHSACRSDGHQSGWRAAFPVLGDPNAS